MFRIARQTQIFQDVLDQIEEAIVSGRLEPGDKLPPERELREALDISRPTLREALRVLEEKGLIEIRVGVKGGAYVKKVGVEGITGGLGLMIRQQRVSLGHLYEFREGVEGNAAGLATERASRAQLDELWAGIDQAVRRLPEEGGDGAPFYEAESKLHLLVARMSGNPIFEWVLSAIHTGIHSYIHLLPHTRQDLEMLIADWQAIAAAMQNRQVTNVQTLTTVHAARANAHVREAGRSSGQQINNIMLEI